MSDPSLQAPDVTAAAIAAARGAIVSFGARTPIGLSATASCAAARARVARFLRSQRAGIAAHHDFTVSSIFRGERFDPAQPTTFAERMTGPAAAAAAEALRGFAGTKAPGGTPLAVLVGLPGPGREVPEAESAAVCEAVARAAASAGFRPEVEVFAAGHAAGFRALGRALELVARNPDTACLVGAADSYLTPETLAHLHRRGQLKSDLHRWGFVAGEAACFSVVVPAEAALARPAPPLAWVLSAASAVEPVAPRGTEPILGKALAEAIRSALSPLPADLRVDETVCDLNGERWRGEEIGFVIPRLADRFTAPGRFSTPATAFGDTGAATGPLSWAFAAHSASRGLSRGPFALTFASEDGPGRGAALLFTPVAERA